MTGVAFGVAGLLLLLGAWLRAAGTAMTRIPRADALRDASDDVNGAETVARLLDNREVITPAVGAVSSGLLVLAAVVATAVLARAQTLGTALISGVAIGVVAFLLGDLIPRRLGRLRPEPLAYRSHGLLSWAIALGGWANDLLPDPDLVEEADDLFEDEDPEEQERELIDSVLDFGDTIVREVMTPRPDMTTVAVTDSIETLIETSSSAGYSRIPVISDGDVVGMVIVKDLLRVLTDDSERPTSVAEVMRPVEFVPETKLASVLLAEMQESHSHQMIVVDEYGDVAGLVTIEDLLEELVGEIADETDSEQPMIAERFGGWVMDGRLPIDDFCKVTGLDESDFEGDTVGGLILELAERIPEEGESFEVGDLTLKVTAMQGRRVSEVSASRTERVESG